MLSEAFEKARDPNCRRCAMPLPGFHAAPRQSRARLLTQRKARSRRKPSLGNEAAPIRVADLAEGAMVRRSWRTELKAATTEEDVLDVASRFLGEWTRVEMALVPRGAWPSRVTTRADVLSHAAVLGGLHSHFAGPAVALPGLQELLLFFTHAAVRVAQLTALRDPAVAASPMRKPVVGRRRPAASRAARVR